MIVLVVFCAEFAWFKPVQFSSGHAVLRLGSDLRPVGHAVLRWNLLSYCCSLCNCLVCSVFDM